MAIKHKIDRLMVKSTGEIIPLIKSMSLAQLNDCIDIEVRHPEPRHSLLKPLHQRFTKVRGQMEQKRVLKGDPEWRQ